MTHVVLTVVCPPAAEERLWDFLLIAQETGVFTSARVSGHGVHPMQLDVTEQVAGRVREIMFQLVLTAESAQALLSRLRAELQGAALRYWLLPVLESGEIG